MTPSTTDVALELRGIHKRFGPVVANRDISLQLRQGEILALLGENGAGKTTLMSILFGHYLADQGEIQVFGKPLSGGSPGRAIAAGIGMVHQHFSLAENLSVLENIVLGTEPLWWPFSRPRRAEERLRQLSIRFGLQVEPARRVGSLSVGERQRVEILKALYRGARILVLDEPTAVLTPQESQQLFTILRQMVSEGLAIILISHKLDEVLRVAQRIAVLRHGELVGNYAADAIDRTGLARAMVGGELPIVEAQRLAPGKSVLRLEEVFAPGLSNLNFTVAQHQILGIAGVAGNGQQALGNLLAGLLRPTAGRLLLGAEVLGRCSPAHLIRRGVGRIPEDRHRGIVGDLSVAENLILEDRHIFSRFGWLRPWRITAFAQQLIAAFGVRGATADTRAANLSGGNLQKLLLARTLSRNPRLIIASQPTRGLDVGAAAYVHEELLRARQRGAAVLLISEDLEELRLLAERVMVIYRGRLSPELITERTDAATLGLWMSGEHFRAEDHHAA